jgi:hypothetical protein
MHTTDERGIGGTFRRSWGRLRAGWAGLLLGTLLLATGPATAQAIASPHAVDIPRWFSNSLLDFKDEIPEAAREGKRVMVYFGQDGCPYCKALMKANRSPSGHAGTSWPSRSTSGATPR